MYKWPPGWVGLIPQSTSGNEVISARSRLEATAKARRRPNILDSFNSTAPAKRILRDEGRELQ